MNIEQTIIRSIEESIATKRAILTDPSLLLLIEKMAVACLDSLKSGGKIIFAGNGGSFADAQHLSAEFTSRYAFDRPSLPSLALGCNNSAISAIGNDYGYDQVFSRELSSIAQPNDVYVPISTSGNSPNILSSIQVAKEKGLEIFGFTGRSGGEMKDTCQCLRVPSDSTGRIQESHIMIGHILCGIVEREYFAS